MKLQLIDKKDDVQDIVSFFFKPEQKVEWKAGQYMRYHIDDPNSDDRGENRFFSISAAPFEQNLRVTTKFSPDGGSSFKKNLQKLNIGDFIDAHGPLGAFVIDEANQEYVFIAGGIGITPFRSILMDLNNKNLPINVTLLYANRTEEVVFRAELESLKANNPNFKIAYFIGETKIDENAIRNDVPDLTKPYYYISGPEPMVQAFEKMLYGMGISEDHVKRDYFPGYTQI
jgi:glycine betaine catabolism B